MKKARVHEVKETLMLDLTRVEFKRGQRLFWRQLRDRLVDEGFEDDVISRAIDELLLEGRLELRMLS